MFFCCFLLAPVRAGEGTACSIVFIHSSSQTLEENLCLKRMVLRKYLVIGQFPEAFFFIGPWLPVSLVSASVAWLYIADLPDLSRPKTDCVGLAGFSSFWKAFSCLEWYLLWAKCVIALQCTFTVLITEVLGLKDIQLLQTVWPRFTWTFIIIISLCVKVLQIKLSGFFRMPLTNAPDVAV